MTTPLWYSFLAPGQDGRGILGKTVHLSNCGGTGTEFLGKRWRKPAPIDGLRPPLRPKNREQRGKKPLYKAKNLPFFQKMVY
ncbi:hypothetical protein HMPREF0262_02646 [Clostridium sp. ATCC 29733]|nr:hypothetical protein HMPREF0262_02646 [Clostridium sp. ATCC 29733]